MEGADGEVLPIEPAEKPKSSKQEDDVEQEERVRDEGIDAQEDEHEDIVAGEGAEVVVDARLDLAKVLGLGEALEVEELADRSQVGKSAG